jgi:hypothetical protein
MRGGPSRIHGSRQVCLRVLQRHGPSVCKSDQTNSRRSDRETWRGRTEPGPSMDRLAGSCGLAQMLERQANDQRSLGPDNVGKVGAPMPGLNGINKQRQVRRPAGPALLHAQVALRIHQRRRILMSDSWSPADSKKRCGFMPRAAHNASDMGRAASQFVCPKVFGRKQRGKIVVSRSALSTTYLRGNKSYYA